MKNDGGPTFPSAFPGMRQHQGMTLRDYFAAAALPALVVHYTDSFAAQKAYEHADAMLAERDK